MNLLPSDEQVALRDSVRRCLGETNDGTWTRLIGITGIDLGMAEIAIVAEECGRALYPEPWLATVLAARSVDDADLRAAIEGGTTAALVLGDRAPGVPVADVVVVPVGDELLAFARDDVKVVAADGVDPTMPVGSVDIGAAGGRPVGPVRAGLDDDLRVGWAADALGAAGAVLDIAVEYAKVRRQFDQPIGAFQAVQHLCVDMYETVELARGGVLHAAWAADSDDPGRHVAALRLRAFADRLATVGDTAIQVLGGIGFTWEHDAHRYLRRLLSWTSAPGSPTAARVELGRQLVGQA